MKLTKEIKETLENIETPAYIYLESILKESINRVKSTLGKIGSVHYALKANSNPYLLKIIKERGFFADAVSGNEVKLALKIGFERVLFSGVGKTEREIALATNNRVGINAESIEEIKLIAKILPGSEIGIRINPGIDAHTHKYITTGKIGNKFGVPIKYAKNAFVFAKDAGLKPVRLHMHIGSQMLNDMPLLSAAKTAKEFAKELDESGIKVRQIDLGGGFGISYDGKSVEFPLNHFSETVSKMLGKQYELLFEPGRAVVAHSGFILTKVLYRKFGEKNFIVTDCGMNDFIRPALYGAKHRAFPLFDKDSPLITADIVGPVCESSDFIAKDVRIPLPAQGELLLVSDTGAYGYAMSSNYNLRCKPSEYLIKENGGLLKIRDKVCPEF